MRYVKYLEMEGKSISNLGKKTKMKVRFLKYEL